MTNEGARYTLASTLHSKIYIVCVCSVGRAHNKAPRKRGSACTLSWLHKSGCAREANGVQTYGFMCPGVPLVNCEYII